MITILNLDGDDLNQAILTYITECGIDLDNKDINITMTAGRKGNGHKAEVTITAARTAREKVSVASISHSEVTTTDAPEEFDTSLDAPGEVAIAAVSAVLGDSTPAFNEPSPEADSTDTGEVEEESVASTTPLFGQAQ